VAELTDQAIERHGGDLVEDCAQFQAEAPVGGQERITGHLRSHRAIPQDEMRQDGEHRFARRALDTPDGETTRPDADIMGVPCETPASATGGRVPQLKAQGEDERDHPFDKRLAVAKQLNVSRFIVEIDGNGPVFAGLAGCVAHGSPSGQMVEIAGDPRCG
jgi:hypothetical protein